MELYKALGLKAAHEGY